MKFNYHIRLVNYVLLILFISQFLNVRAQDSFWITVDNGLFVGNFTPAIKSITGESEITIVKIDPHLYTFKLLCSGEQKHANLTVKEWCEKYHLIGAVNAGMFQTDFRSNVGYMKNYTYFNNTKINSKYLSVAAFDPVNDSLNPFKIFDIDEENMNEIINNYHVVIQNLRLIKNPAENRWTQQNKKWSEVALGQDAFGNVLFIFSRAPYSMHDFNKILISLPIHVNNTQHLEGGPEASLYFSFNNTEIIRMGSYETNFTEHDDNHDYWPIPNVIGFVRKETDK